MLKTLAKTKIWGYFHGDIGGTGGGAIACTDDGTRVASHYCSSEGFARHDLGMDGTDWSGKHKVYESKFPDGYDLEFVYGGKSAWMQAVKGGH